MSTTIVTRKNIVDRQQPLLRSASIWRELIIIGAMAVAYAALSLELIGFIITFLFVPDKPMFSSIFYESSWNTFTIFAALAFGVSGMFAWCALVMQKNNYSPKAGFLAGLTSTVLAQPLMIFFWGIMILGPTFAKSNLEGLSNDVMVLVGLSVVGMVFEFLFAWIIWLPSLAFGAVGGWLATLLIRKLKGRSLNVSNI